MSGNFGGLADGPGSAAAPFGEGGAVLDPLLPHSTVAPDWNQRSAMPRLGKLYFASHRALGRVIVGLSAAFSGVWLGLLPRRVLYLIDAAYYDRQRYYQTEDYNRSGLWPWERRAIETHFAGCRSLLVGAAGGGREVLALRRDGLDVHGFECHPALAQFANELLSKDGYAPDIRLALRDSCPDFGRTYDGLVVGWGAYMLIRGRQRRIDFLRQLRKHAKPGAPVLLSFFHMVGGPRRYRIAAAIGNVFALVLRGERVEVGDFLVPDFVHYFTREELESELRAGGFEPILFGTNEYGHAVGRAVE
jgi:hypothetical protein